MVGPLTRGRLACRPAPAGTRRAWSRYVPPPPGQKLLLAGVGSAPGTAPVGFRRHAAHLPDARDQVAHATDTHRKAGGKLRARARPRFPRLPDALTQISCEYAFAIRQLATTTRLTQLKSAIEGV